MLLSCAVPAPAPVESPEQWRSQLRSDHELVGKVWNSATGEYVSSSELFEAVASARYLLLGEKHDNPDHHDLQLATLNYLLASSAVSLVAFEMMDGDADQLLAQLPTQSLDSRDQLKNYLEWDEEGWDWEFYGPLVDAVYRAGIPIAAANMSGAKMMQVYSEELPSEVSAVLDADVIEQLNLDIDESHCGLLPESQFPSMVRVQQFRDYTMAQSLIAAEEGDLAILIAGNYHIREDLGVANYLKARLPLQNEAAHNDVVSLAFLEVSAESADPSDYLQKFSDTVAYDYIWFTPAVSDEDYCASLRQQQ